MTTGEGVTGSPPLSFNLDGVSVMLCMPTHRDLPPQTTASILETWDALRNHNIEAFINIQSGSSLVQSARNKCAHMFLESKFTRLFWVDSDMSWGGADFLRLLALSTKLEVVGASYPMRCDPIQFCVKRDFSLGGETNEYGCIDVDGFGLGFTCVQRKVIEALATQAHTTLLPDMGQSVVAEIFRTHSKQTERSKEMGADGEFCGEDMLFFSDVRQLGYPVWMDPSVKLGHIGPKTYEASFSEMLKLEKIENGTRI